MTDSIYFVPYDDIKVGDAARRSFELSEDLVKRFSELIGDEDSFHVRDDRAAITVFKRRIVHGVHLLALISCLIGQELPGFGTIYCSHEFSFERPVYVGDSVGVRVEVLEKLPSHRLKLNTAICDGCGRSVLDGTAIIKTYK